jgi:hypothetical protein
MLEAFNNNNPRLASTFATKAMENTKDDLEINDDLFNSIIFEKVPYVVP